MPPDERALSRLPLKARSVRNGSGHSTGRHRCSSRRCGRKRPLGCGSAHGQGELHGQRRSRRANCRCRSAEGGAAHVGDGREVGGHHPRRCRLKQAMPTLERFMMPFSGQVCFAQTRILVPRSREAEIVDAYASRLSTLKISNPCALDTESASEHRTVRKSGCLHIARD